MWVMLERSIPEFLLCGAVMWLLAGQRFGCVSGLLAGCPCHWRWFPAGLRGWQDLSIHVPRQVRNIRTAWSDDVGRHGPCTTLSYRHLKTVRRQVHFIQHCCASWSWTFWDQESSHDLNSWKKTSGLQLDRRSLPGNIFCWPWRCWTHHFQWGKQRWRMWLDPEMKPIYCSNHPDHSKSFFISILLYVRIIQYHHDYMIRSVYGSCIHILRFGRCVCRATAPSAQRIV